MTNFFKAKLFKGFMIKLEILYCFYPAYENSQSYCQKNKIDITNMFAAYNNDISVTLGESPGLSEHLLQCIEL